MASSVSRLMKSTGVIYIQGCTIWKTREEDVRVAITLLISLLSVPVPSSTAADTLPRALTDDAFWRLVTDFSEQGGAFRFEYMSNEQQFQYVIPRLVEGRKAAGVYLGVGPEQNFTY